jgi:DmsE family decaheme c-type cytochrome
MVKKAERWLLIAVSVLAMTHGAVALSADKQKDSSSNQKTSGDKQSAGLKGTQEPVDPSQYVGADTCKGCHEEEAASYDKGPHGKTTSPKHEGPQWQGCEACHGPGKEHAEAADPDKIIRPAAVSREESSKRCLGCHEFEQGHVDFLRSEHFKNNVGCLNCHSIHASRARTPLLRAVTPQLCYSCHAGIKPDSSKPAHHGVTEGKESCKSCHNPHGGFPAATETR